MMSFQHIVTQGSRSVKVVSPAETVASSAAPSVGAASIDIEEFTKPSQVFVKERKASDIAKEVEEVLAEKKAADVKGEPKEASKEADIVTTETPRSRRTSARTAAKAEQPKAPEKPLATDKDEPAEKPDVATPSKSTPGKEKDLPKTPAIDITPASPVAGTSAETVKTTASERFEEMLRWLEKNNAGKLEQSDIEAVEVKPGKYELQAHGMPVVFKEITVN